VTLEEARALDAADPLSHCRDRFRLPSGKIYLDGNSLGALPADAPARVARTIEQEWGNHLIESWNRHGWIDAPVTIAAKLAPIVGARPDELLIADSTSVNLFKLLAAAIRARPGRRVVLSEEGNFPTDLYIVQGLQRLIPDLELRTASADCIDEALSEDVAVLMLTHVDYRSARRHDMAARTAAAHRAGALALWDLSHSAGVVELELAGCGADLAVGCGYKYLNGGPGAPSFLFVASALQEQLENVLSGWMGHAAPFEFDAAYRPRDGIGRFLTGTPSIVALAALEAGLDSFDGVTVAAVEAKTRALTDFFIACVEARCPGLALASPRDSRNRGGHVIFAHPGGYAIVQALIARGIVGDFRAPDQMRFGFAALYNRFEDAWLAAEAVFDLIETGAWAQPQFHRRSRVT